MLENLHVDVVISNDLSSQLANHQVISRNSRLPQFNKWYDGLVRSFTFSDVTMLIRRSSLAFIGLYDTSFTMMDWEYSLRMSYLQANIVYYTGYNALNVAHRQTVTSGVNIKTLREEGNRGKAFYDYAGDESEINYWSKIKIFIGKIIYKTSPINSYCNISGIEITDIYTYYYRHLEDLNQKDNFSFISGACPNDV